MDEFITTACQALSIPSTFAALEQIAEDAVQIPSIEAWLLCASQPRDSGSEMATAMAWATKRDQAGAGSHSC